MARGLLEMNVELTIGLVNCNGSSVEDAHMPSGTQQWRDHGQTSSKGAHALVCDKCSKSQASSPAASFIAWHEDDTCWCSDCYRESLACR